MRVTCPNCDLKVMFDAASLSDAPVEIACVRCAAPLRLRLVCETAAHAHADAALRAGATHANAPRVFTSKAHGASETALGGSTIARRDGSTLMSRAGSTSALRDGSTSATRDSSPFATPCVVLPLEEAGGALSLAHAGALSAEDTYRLGARLLNLSPLRLLFAGVAFVALVAFCDLLLASRALNTGDTALASLQNQATNRSFNSRRATPSTGDDQDYPEPAAARPAEDADTHATDAAHTKPAPVSDDPAASGAPALISDADATHADANAAHDNASATRADARAEAAPVAAREVAASEPAVAAGEQPASKLTLQLASYRSEEEAQGLARKIQDAGFEARVVAEQNSKRPWYCVQVGNFAARDEVTQRLSELRAKGFASSYTVREIQ